MSADTSDLRQQMRRELRRLADPTYRESINTVVTTDGETMGVRVPALRAVAKSWMTRARPPTQDQAAALLDVVCEDRCREEILFAVFLLAHHRRSLSQDLWPRVDCWIEGIDNWETCDQIAMNIGGEIAAEHPHLVEDLVAWTASQNCWRRRFAVVCTTVLNQKGRSSPEATLRVCRPLLGDADQVVLNAVGWALREACKGGAAEVFAFLREHRQQLPRRLLREASQKLTPAQRAELSEGLRERPTKPA